MSTAPAPSKIAIKYVPLDDLPDASINPKDHDLRALDDSLERFGFMEPVIVDERTGQLLAGHGRKQGLIARRDAGKEPPAGIQVKGTTWLVPVVTGVSSANDVEAKAALVALNRITERGGWHNDLLATLLAEIRDASASFDGIGYDQSDLDDLIASLPSLPDFAGGSGGGSTAEAPDEFPEVDPEAMETDYRCPGCGWEWSGQPKP